MILTLTPSDLRTLFAAIPGVPTRNVAVTVSKDRLLINLIGIDYAALIPEPTLLQQITIAAAPADAELWMTGQQVSGKAIAIRWGPTGLFAAIAQTLGLGSLVIQRLFAGCPAAVSEVSSDAFKLHLDRLPEPMPSVIRPWLLRQVQIPSVDGLALKLVAEPAAEPAPSGNP